MKSYKRAINKGRTAANNNFKDWKIGTSIKPLEKQFKKML